MYLPEDRPRPCNFYLQPQKCPFNLVFSFSEFSASAPRRHSQDVGFVVTVILEILIS